MQKYKIVFSIPVHERPDVVLDQIENIIYNNPECAIVLHISNRFNDNDSNVSLESFFNIISKHTSVYVNPKRLKTDKFYIRGLYKAFSHMGWGEGIFLTHISNFIYIKDIVDFEFIVLLSSNELFVKRGTYQFIKNYIAGSQGYNRLVEMNTKWSTGRLAFQDKILKKIIKSVSTENNIYGGQVEGSWYSKKIFSTICEKITSIYPKKSLFPHKYYVKEEIYYPTLLSYIAKEKGNNVFRGNITYVLWDKKDMMASVDDIKVAIQSKNFFSIKRITRDVDDPIRKYVKTVLCENYRLD